MFARYSLGPAARSVIFQRANTSPTALAPTKKTGAATKRAIAPIVRKKGKSDTAVKIQDIVIPAPVKEMTLNAEEKEMKRVIDLTFKKYRTERYTDKKEEIQTMWNKMAEANLELERTDPVLFQKAMVKDMENYMPVDRRYPVDTPPVLTWNSDNRLSTQLKKEN